MEPTPIARRPLRHGALAVALAVFLTLVVPGTPVATAVGPVAANVPPAAGTPMVRSVVTPQLAPAAVVLPDPDVLTARLKKVSSKGIGRLGLIVTTTDGLVLAGRSADSALTPASTMKVLSTMAAVDSLGADHTFVTSVVRPSAGRIVLVGGGDPMLTDKVPTADYRLASLQRLANLTAAELKAAGRTSVALAWDASLFSGPTFSPEWKARWRGTEARVAALEINSGKLAGGGAAANPARQAAKAFAKRLRAAGITVTSVAAGTAAGTVVASVRSA
jgi:D-alanyl-D-alanine carboxypeptidase/D-alanyl-D-alanine-endopeptidase (penicillin-binding protein 4)